MLGPSTTRQICTALKDCYRRGPGFKLEYVEAWTGALGYPVSRQTVSRAIQSPPTRLRRQTGVHLAQFLEHLTDGNIRAADLLRAEGGLSQPNETAAANIETAPGLLKVKLPLTWNLLLP